MSGKRISREKLTIKKMIDLYQAKCPQASAEPEHYEALFVYAQKRLDKCVFGEEKPACKQCPVHCYQPAKREEMKQIILEENGANLDSISGRKKIFKKIDAWMKVLADNVNAERGKNK